MGRLKITIFEYGKSASSKRKRKKNTGFHQNEKLCAKDTINKAQRQSTEQKEIFANHISDNEITKNKSVIWSKLYPHIHKRVYPHIHKA